MSRPMGKRRHLGRRRWAFPEAEYFLVQNPASLSQVSLKKGREWRARMHSLSMSSPWFNQVTQRSRGYHEGVGWLRSLRKQKCLSEASS